MASRRLLLVVGSVNYDLIFSHPHIPGPGENVTRAELARSCGGKGANQAVVAARCARACPELGAVSVVFAGAIGDDEFGAEQRAVLLESGVEISHLKTIPDTYTGTSSVWVESGTGQNRIVNASGANLCFLPQDAEQLPYEQAALVLVQNEIPARTIERVVALARAHSVPVIWNPAPMVGADVPELDPRSIRWVTPNESEASVLLGDDDPDDPSKAARTLLDRGFAGVVLTVGEHGVWLADHDGIEHLPAPRVGAVDTTGAGDAFNGAFGAALAAGYPAHTAARFGVAYASESVRYPGTQTAFPRALPDSVAQLLHS